MGQTSNSVAKGFGPRLMRMRPPFHDADKERAELEALLALAPGVEAILEIRPHPRGGFVAVMDFSMAQLDAWIAHLDAQGWRGVM